MHHETATRCNIYHSVKGWAHPCWPPLVWAQYIGISITWLSKPSHSLTCGTSASIMKPVTLLACCRIEFLTEPLSMPPEQFYTVSYSWCPKMWHDSYKEGRAKYWSTFAFPFLSDIQYAQPLVYWAQHHTSTLAIQMHFVGSSSTIVELIPKISSNQ